MSIVRYENVLVNNLVTTTTSLGDQVTAITLWFATRGLVHDLSNNLRISDRYRVYSDLLNITLNYTPNTKQIANNQNLYSFTWNNQDWRITDCRESNDRQKVTFTCYRNDPTVPV